VLGDGASTLGLPRLSAIANINCQFDAVRLMKPSG
jgi:hypothetical protein